jgi:hypothetical protein
VPTLCHSGERNRIPDACISRPRADAAANLDKIHYREEIEKLQAPPLRGVGDTVLYHNYPD